jgi:FkbM family methyltransferase
MEQFVDFTKIPSHKKRIKIDVGLSYYAPHTQNWFENDNKDDSLYVFGFEPNKFNCEIINNKNIIKRERDGDGKALSDEFINTDHFQLIPVALSNKTGFLDFYCTNLYSCSSLYYPIDNGIGPIIEITKVPVFTLKNFFDLFDWNRFPIIEYIKIDAQGADLDILIGAENYLQERVVYITAEPESRQYNNCQHNTAENMNNYLESKGFIPINHPNTVDPTFINKNFIHLKDSIYIFQDS